VNPFLISDPFLKGDVEFASSLDDDSKDDADVHLCGWCVFDSMSGNSQEKTDQWFHGTFYTQLDPSLGVRLFLNICTSYLKSRKSDENNEGEADEFKYEEPFGDYSASDVVHPEVTEIFCLDYTSPNIILQQNSNDCGFASVANAIAFVLQMKTVPFTFSNLELYDPSEHQPTMSPVNVVANQQRSIMRGRGIVAGQKNILAM
jgi:hypothetical protein